MDLTKLSSYDYNLPKELIAQEHAYPAHNSKLLYFDGKIHDLIFKDIVNLLSSKDILFFNNSKVVKARIIWDDKINFKIIWENNEEKLCKNCELLFLKKLNNNTFESLVRPGKKLKKWKTIKITKQNKEYIFKVKDYLENWRIIEIISPKKDIFEILDEIGKMPLPPYIEYSEEKEKPYQPIQAKKEGSVAAPTASLHFTPELIKRLKEQNIKFLESTLHIWMWTFKTVDTEDITKYNIHSETVEIPLSIFEKIADLKKNHYITAVGTTSTRILESLPYLYQKIKLENPKLYNQLKRDFWENFKINKEQANNFIQNINFYNNTIQFDTKLYIYPGFEFKIIDKLITNFHLPKSSLLMLVAAFMWYENMFKCYQHAIKNNYKFFSFWDAMFIDKTKF